MQKVKNSGKTEVFGFSTGGRWHREPVHGWDIWIDAKHRYVRYSPRYVAVAVAMRRFWTLNRGTRFPWEETLRSVSAGFLRGAGRLRREDYVRAKEIIRELGPVYMTEDGESFVYASTRGGQAVAGFVAEPIDAMSYEERNHQMLRVMEARIAIGTVEAAGAEFGVPVKPGKITTKTL